MCDFYETTLGEVIELKRGYDLPQQNRELGSVPIISSSGVSGHHSTYMVTGPGVVTGRYGTLGQVFYAQEDFWPLNTTLYVQNFRGNDPRFISYFLRSIDFLAYSDKAAVPGLNRNHLHTANVRYPKSIIEQRAIASILGALDDKIDLNRRMNETLEAMARALFQEWFVDFGPVRAKAEGRQPECLLAEVAALFPDSLDEEGKPEGWIFQTLGQHCMNFDAQRIPVSGADRAKRHGKYPYYGAASIMDHIDDYLFDGNYLLIGEDGSVVGEGGLAVTQYVTGKFWVNNHAHVLQGKDSVSTEQLKLYFNFEPVEPYITGAVQAKLSQGRMNTMPFLFAGPQICKAFSSIVDPLFKCIFANKAETTTLGALRDFLLPKLMSGEIRVKDAERLVEQAA